jgi:cytidine deaminase
LSIKDEAIKQCLEARKRAICRKTYVGAAIYSDTKVITGYNVENRCQKGYHAEEICVINCIIQEINPKELKGIIISFSDNDITRLTFMCGHCRQVVWEYVLNPEFLVTEVDLDGNIIKEVFLNELYPYPYPRSECAKVNGRPD